jgi:hypothetical protein
MELDLYKKYSRLLSYETGIVLPILSALEMWRKATISFVIPSVWLSVCLYALKNSASTARIFMKLHV